MTNDGAQATNYGLMHSRGVILEGHEFDKETWIEHFGSLPDPLVTWETQEGQPRLLVLRSSRFTERMSDTEVLREADDVVDLLNGAAATLGARKLVAMHTFRRNPNGTRTFGVVMQETIGLRVRVAAEASDLGDPAATPPVSRAQKWLWTAVRGDVVVRNALTYMGRSDNWYDLFRLLEVVRADCNKVDSKGARLAPVRMGLIDEDEAVRLGDSINARRHHNERQTDDLMGFNEARSKLLDLAYRWLEWRSLKV
jgi:hypothetical protein